MERRRLREPLGGAAGRKATHCSHDASLAAGRADLGGAEGGTPRSRERVGRLRRSLEVAAEYGGGGGSGGRGSRRGATGVFPLREWRRRDLGN